MKPNRAIASLDSGYPEHAPSAVSVQSWLVTRLARITRINPDTIDVCEEFTSYGLGSLQAIQLMGELGDWMGRELPETLIWDYPTIESLSTHLGEVRQPAFAGVAS